MPRKKSRTELLPPYNSPHRTLCLKILFDFPDYREKQQEGYPLRTEEELNEIVERYQSRYEGDKIGGITFEEINFEQGKKSPIIKLKKPTFRKYIQDGLLPKSIDYVNIEKKRIALFPKDTITHINFLYYFYQVADANVITALKKMASDEMFGITFREAIESSSDYNDIYLAVGGYCGYGDPDIIGAVKEALANKPDEMKFVIESIEKIANKFTESLEELIKYIENNSLEWSEFKK